jgi:hypothetical protein
MIQSHHAGWERLKNNCNIGGGPRVRYAIRTLLLLGEGGTVMNTITPDVVVAYSHCTRKAFLILHAEDPGMPHEYVRLLEEKACRNRLSTVQN